MDRDSEPHGFGVSQSSMNQPSPDDRSPVDHFIAEFEALLHPKSSTGRLVFAFIRRNLRVFHLDGIFPEAAILHEAFLRGVAVSQRGTVIHNAAAWLKVTSYNIVREHSRQQRRFVSLEVETVPEASIAPISEEEVETDLTLLQLAYQMLKPREQRLLTLKIMEGRSWFEIRDIFRIEGFGDCTETSLRKQKERALVRLRKYFHTVKVMGDDDGQG